MSQVTESTLAHVLVITLHKRKFLDLEGIRSPVISFDSLFQVKLELLLQNLSAEN